jgi:hypothetical protein
VDGPHGASKSDTVMCDNAEPANGTVTELAETLGSGRSVWPEAYSQQHVSSIGFQLSVFSGALYSVFLCEELSERKPIGGFMFRKIFAAVSFAMFLGGCAADSVQITVGAKDIAAALGGLEVSVPFVAVFESFGELDDEKRSEIEAIEAIVRRHMHIDEFELEQSDSSLKVTVEGEIPLVYRADSKVQSPWVVVVDDVLEDGLGEVFSHSVQFVSGSSFSRFSDEAKGVSVMAAPDKIQPVRFRLRANEGKDLRVLAGGFQEGASSHMMGVVTVPEGESASLLFTGGAYENVGGGFWIMR